MNTILLISEDYLKTNSNLNDNAFGKWILPAIREAQEMSLMPIIGECLYNKVCELVGNGLIDNDLYAAYKDLLDDRIQPFLLYQTLTNIVPIINGKMANIGTVATNDEHIITLSQGELDLTQNYYRERADFYAKRLQDWVKNNREAFPELECVCSAKPNLERANNSIGIFLGGTRGKKVATSTCGCGSSSKSTDGTYQDGFMDGFNQGMQSGYTSGRTDGYEEGLEEGSQGGYTSGRTAGEAAQKAKLVSTAFTQNGTFTREDGWNEVEVNVAGESAKLQNKNVSQSAKIVTYSPDSGYDGISSIKVDASLLANAMYQSGYTAGQDSKPACSLQTKSVVLTAVTQSVSPDSGYDGMELVNMNASALCDSYYQLGYDEGIAAYEPDYWDLYLPMYFTIEALEKGTITISLDRYTFISGSVYYSVNNGEWQMAEYIYDPYGTNPQRFWNISVEAGDKVRFKNRTNGFCLSNTSTKYKVYGNIMSLKYGDDFSGQTEQIVGYGYMFENSEGVTDAGYLVMPSTSGSQYNYLFANCSNLVVGPRKLPQSRVPVYAYEHMFQNCSKLLVAPELPDASYGQYSLRSMFAGCSSLSKIKCYATDIIDGLNQYVTSNWVNGVAANGVFVKSANMTRWPEGNDGIPSGWAVQNKLL